MRINYFKAVVVLSTTFAISCAEKKQLTEMHDSTAKMQETTEKMSNTTVKMADTTENLNKSSETIKKGTSELLQLNEELYDALRQGDSVKIRQSSWENIVRAKKIEDKITNSALYFMSFEMQLWTGFGKDLSLEKRLLLEQQAAQEFFLRVESLAPHNDEVRGFISPLLWDIKEIGETLTDANKISSFNSLASMLHKNNRKQTETITIKKEFDSSVNVKSMLDLIFESFEVKKKLSKNEINIDEVPLFAKEILAHENVAIQLLNARHNFLAALFLIQAAELNNKNMFSQIKGTIWGNIFDNQWTFDISKWNVVRMNYMKTEILDQAIETKKKMYQLGIPLKFDPDVYLMYSRMSIHGQEKANTVQQRQQQQMLLKSIQNLF